MKLQLRWMFFSENLPRGKGLSEIFWIVFLTGITYVLGGWISVFLIRAAVQQTQVLEVVWLSVFVIGIIGFKFAGFKLHIGALIALGLALMMRGFSYTNSGHGLWQAQVALGFWLALRSFSVGPGR